MSSDLHWQKSSYSAGDADNECVEITSTPAAIHLRESDTPTEVLTLTPTTLQALLAKVKAP